MHSQNSTVLIGRFAPPGKAHIAAAQAVIAAGQDLTLILTDSASSRQARIPWTVEERKAMLCAALGDLAQGVKFLAIEDRPYRPEVEAAERARAIGTAQITSFDSRDAEEAVCAAFFAGDDATVAGFVPPQVLAWMQAFRAHDAYEGLATEAAYIADYIASWRSAPWPPVFVTVDTFITCAGHLLLVRRGGQPGRGLWALPGGFIDQKEWVIDAAIRELREETGLALDRNEALACLRHQTVFDYPYRSARGRTITHGFHFALPGDLPEVLGADDAQEARWWPLTDLDRLRGQFLEDHGQMIDYFQN